MDKNPNSTLILHMSCDSDRFDDICMNFENFLNIHIKFTENLTNMDDFECF